jgi:polyferredoxin
MLVVLLFFGAVIMSNMYQDIYEGTDIISQGLQEQPLMSNMILYSPFYMVLIALIAGIFLFAKPSQDDYGGGI